MSMNGAGGTEGGIGRFFLGLVMLIGGGYLFLNSINVTNNFGMGYRMFSMGGVGITTGYVLLPFMLGTGMVFFNAKNYLGWFLMVASIVMLCFGVITSLQFSMQRMNLFQLLSILVLSIGGLGLFLSSLRSLGR